MPNPNHLLIVFNRPIRLGPSAAPGYNVSAKGSDLNPANIAGHGARFIKLSPYSVDLINIVSGNVSIPVLRDKSNIDCIINQNDVVIIKELETGNVIWTSPKAKQIVIELDPSRPKSKIVQLPNGGSKVVFFDKRNCIPMSWIDGLDLRHFPYFVRLHAGIFFRELDAKLIQFDFLGDVYSMEKFYVRKVYWKNGGDIWLRP